MYTKLSGFNVTFKTADGEKVEYHYLWENEIIERLKFWATCVDIRGIEVVNRNTGEVMYHSRPNELDDDEYVCPDWREFYELS